MKKMKNIEKNIVIPKLIIIPEEEWQSIREDIAFLKNAYVKDNNSQLGDWLNEKQAQQLLSRKQTSLWRLREKGKIVSEKYEGAVYYSKQSIIDFLNRNK